MKTFSDYLTETLSKDASAGEWIRDFVHSDNPKFAGKSKAKRRDMALAAHYKKLKEEAEPLLETKKMSPGVKFQRAMERAATLRRASESYAKKEKEKFEAEWAKKYPKKISEDFRLFEDIEKWKEGLSKVYGDGITHVDDHMVEKGKKKKVTVAHNKQGFVLGVYHHEHDRGPLGHVYLPKIHHEEIQEARGDSPRPKSLAVSMKPSFKRSAWLGKPKFEKSYTHPEAQAYFKSVNSSHNYSDRVEPYSGSDGKKYWTHHDTGELVLAKEDLNEGWHKHEDGFSAEISDLEAHVKSGKEVRCPVCKTPQKNIHTHPGHQQIRANDPDQEVTHWIRPCKCGTRMTIWNDDVNEATTIDYNKKTTFATFKSDGEVIGGRRFAKLNPTRRARDILRWHKSAFEKKHGPLGKLTMEEHDKRHQGPYDRGAADAYYGRKKNPHYYDSDKVGAKKIEHHQMKPHEIEAYHAGYDADMEGRKDYN
jgi:hypothetical protein